MNKRTGWAGLPADVRAGVEGVLGEPVIDANSQSGGFSPGSADRVLLASGRRAFVKAVSGEINAASAALHRREAAVTAALPDGVPAPRLLGVHDDGSWVALVLTDVDGRHPAEPWVDAELGAVLDALAAMGRTEVPGGLVLPRCEDALRGAFLGWEKIRKRPFEGLEPWAAAKLDLLAERARHGVGCLAGNTLVHGDLRTDNILLTDSGAVLVDWPWAAVGAPWVDALAVLVNVKTLDPGRGLEPLLGCHPVFAGVGAGDVEAVLAGFAGYFMDMSRRPAPPGIPTLRGFQRRQGDALLGWLKTRL